MSDSGSGSASSQEDEKEPATPVHHRRPRGRPKTATPVKAVRKKESNRGYGKTHKSIRLSQDTFARLTAFRQLHSHKSWDNVMLDLLKIHPHTPAVPRKPAAQLPAEEVKETVLVEDEGASAEATENRLRSVVVTRMVSEGGASVNKVPVLLALASIYFKGRIYKEEIVSSTQITRMTEEVFEYDAGLLRKELKELSSVHLQCDISGRKGEERLSVWLTGFLKSNRTYLRRCIWSGALASKAGYEQFIAVYGRLTHLEVNTKLRSLTADEGMDATGPTDGLYGRLCAQLKRKLLLVNCDLHKLDRGLVVACHATFGPAEANKPSVLQLLYLIPYLMRPWSKYKPLFLRHVLDDRKDSITQPVLPITTRWHTVIAAANFAHTNSEPVRDLAREIYDYFPSAQRVIRTLWKQVDVWLHVDVLRLQVAVILDFGKTFYTNEMKWATADQFRCVELPNRWVARMHTLDAALQSPESYFLTFYETAEALGSSDEDKARVEGEIKVFLLAVKKQYQGTSDKWLAFPHIACALGDATVGIAQTIAHGLVAAREGSKIPDIFRTSPLLANLTGGSLRDSKHELFEDPALFASIKALRAVPLQDSRCAALADWLNDNVRCVSSQQLNVESSFNILSDVIQVGRGRRKSGTEVKIQDHLQNRVHVDRKQAFSSTTGEPTPWKPTKENLVELERSVLSYCDHMRTVAKEPVQAIETGYLAKFERDAARAQPSRRRPYDSAALAEAVIVRQPYDPQSEGEDDAEEEADEDQSDSKDVDSNSEDAESDSGDKNDSQSSSEKEEARRSASQSRIGGAKTRTDLRSTSSSSSSSSAAQMANSNSLRKRGGASPPVQAQGPKRGCPEPIPDIKEAVPWEEFRAFTRKKLKVPGSWFQGDFAKLNADKWFEGEVQKAVKAQPKAKLQGAQLLPHRLEVKFKGDRLIYRVTDPRSLLPYIVD